MVSIVPAEATAMAIEEYFATAEFRTKIAAACPTCGNMVILVDLVAAQKKTQNQTAKAAEIAPETTGTTAAITTVPTAVTALEPTPAAAPSAPPAAADQPVVASGEETASGARAERKTGRSSATVKVKKARGSRVTSNRSHTGVVTPASPTGAPMPV